MLQGVELQLFQDKAVVASIPTRVDRLDSQLKKVLLDEQLKPRDAAALACKLQFVAQSLFGQAGQAALRPLHLRAGADRRRRQRDWPLSTAIKEAINWLRQRLQRAGPRLEVAVIYADAFFELGGRRVRPSEDLPETLNFAPASFSNGFGFVATIKGHTWFFAGSVPMWFTRHFSSRRAFIYMLKAVAQVVPLVALQSLLPQHLLLFIDNEPARQGLMKGYGKDPQINKLIQAVWSLIEDRQWWPEWQRVCSEANVSDAVSRFCFANAYAECWEWFGFNLDETLRCILHSTVTL